MSPRYVGRVPVHPRSRGEHSCPTPPRARNRGSSPLPRGTPDRKRDDRDNRRFIPAPAGNTASCSRSSVRLSVHPRSRGEHDPRAGDAEYHFGSSPLPRGTLKGCLFRTLSMRFIPAPAGNTNLCGRRRRVASVHPRSRGEHKSPSIATPVPNGSSPLPRGTRARHAAPHEKGRFIPAPAGNTKLVLISSIDRTVHPRSRGEHCRRTPSRSAHVGSSPLPRGTQRSPPQAHD